MDVNKIISNILAGDFQDVKELIKNQPHKVNDTNFDGKTLLMAASQRGSIELIELLIKAGAGLDTSDKIGKTALHYAVERQKLEAVRILLKCGSEINRKDNDGNTPLHLAASFKIVNERMKIFVKTEWKEGVEALLQSQEVEVNQQNNIGRTPLHVASLYGYTDTVGLLLTRKDINANVVDEDGNTPLHLAVKLEHYDVVTLMLSQDSVKMDMKNHQQMTPLLEAARVGNLEIMNSLIARGSDVNATDGNLNNSLHVALKTEMFHSGDAAIDILDKFCAELNLEKKERLSGIVVARYLASLGADFYHKNDQNKTPLDLIENQKLKNKLLTLIPPQCLWCKTKAASIKSHPCEHLVTCEKCSKVTFKRCFVCQEPVTSSSGVESPKFEEKEVQTVEETAESANVKDREVQTDFQLFEAASQQVDIPTVVKEVLTSSQPVESPQLKEKELLRVAMRLGSDWWQVGILLGIEISEREIEDDSHDTVKQGYLMLRKWFTSCDPETRTRETLTAALEEAGCLGSLQYLLFDAK